MSRVGAIILAAGGSRRLGVPKALLEVGGVTFIRRIVTAAQNGGCESTVVVTGETHDRLAQELADTPAELVHHRHWEQGIGSSIRAGVDYLLGNFPAVERVLLLTCDQPFVNAKLISALIATTAPIAACSYANTVGTPAIFARSYASELRNLADQTGAKILLQRERNNAAIIPFEDGAVDIDTPADLVALEARYESLLK